MRMQGECFALFFSSHPPRIRTAIRRESGTSAAARPYRIENMDHIGRKPLPHDGGPLFSANTQGEVYFITICCIPRHTNQLATPAVWQVIEETLSVREAKNDLNCRLILAMPDHLHGLFEFPGPNPMTKVISDFKSWLAKQCGIHWQRDFFDHRLRNIESAAEKANYIRLNPVRAGLATNPQDWPYQR
jgi:REP element-mobilizing transposase RayT